MRHYALVTIALLLLFLVLFAAVEALEVPLLTDPLPVLRVGSAFGAVVGVGLLVADVVLPVPSSVVMVAHGAMFGVVVGTLLSLVGSLAAMLLGFGIGRRGGPLLERLVPADERRRADDLLDRWGVMAIVVTRPLPLLAETVAILAGASPLPWSRAALAAVIGSLPGALLYALTGAVAATFASTATVFAVVTALAGLVWITTRSLDATRLRSSTSAPVPAVVRADAGQPQGGCSGQGPR